MTTYPYQCQSCSDPFEIEMRMSEFHTSLRPPCPSCQSTNVKRVLTVPHLSFVGDGWPGKNNRVRNQMKKKNQRLAAKERDMKGDGVVPKLLPNVGGERTDSWSEAAKLARSKGNDASGYESLARKESAGST